MPLTRSISAGLLDSAFASLATFFVGLYAAYALEPAVLGLYALTFAAFTMASMVSHQALFLPAEAWAASQPKRVGPDIVRSSLSLAPVPALAIPAVFALLLLVAPSGSPDGTLSILAITGAAAALVSPIQDHVRRVLHLTGASHRAVTVSVVQLTVVVSALVWGAGRFPPETLPFGVLAVANAISLFTGLAFCCGLSSKTARMERPTISHLMRSGRWLLVAQSSTEMGGFVAATLLARLGSMEALGFAEAARILGRPVLVLTTGMVAVLGPRLMAAGSSRDLAAAQPLRRVFVATAVAVGGGYALLFGWSHGLNPFSHLVPHAFAVPGLVLATVMASVIRAMSLPRRFEAIGGGRERNLARIDVAATSVQTLFSGFAGILQGFTLAVGMVGFAVARMLGLRALSETLYAAPPPHGPSVVPPRRTGPFDRPPTADPEVARAR